MKVAVLTSSRAEYGIYQPLLKRLEDDDHFQLELIVFGSHLSKEHGETVDQIIKDGYAIFEKVPFLTKSDTAEGIAGAIGSTIEAFAPVWAGSDHDWIFALGDRYEMFAAVSSALPFNKKIAHIHGGETTLGAIDNAFRHSISHMSQLHFTATEAYRARVAELIGSNNGIHNVGALSIDALAQEPLMKVEEIREMFDIDLSKPTLLTTLHPETQGNVDNREHVRVLCAALAAMPEYQQVITMPNADTQGSIIRKALVEYAKERENVHTVENFGALGYRSVMKHCYCMLGNTSSGFGEASFFPTPVINIGNRQDGRIRTPNVIDVPFSEAEILRAMNEVGSLRNTEPSAIYGDGNAAERIVEVLRSCK